MMTTSLKKLLLVVFTLFLGVTSSGAMAKTYNSLPVGPSPSSTWSTTGGAVWYSDSLYLIGSSGTSTAYFNDNAGQSVTFSFNYSQYKYDDSARTINQQSWSDTEGGFEAYVDGNSVFVARNPSGTYSYTFTGTGLDNVKFIGGNDRSNDDKYNVAQISFMSVTQDHAPEMNGSLIPQVGLLLGCLFFLMGRKKENTEPMMTV